MGRRRTSRRAARAAEVTADVADLLSAAGGLLRFPFAVVRAVVDALT
ncbi:hypothetical protein [Kineococcus sp. SYSU DK002]